jgi:hypothetical protein
MGIESAQLLCSAHYLKGTIKSIPYKLAFSHHPCAKWARESLDNYIWLCSLGIELCKEYTYRYEKIHGTQKVIEWCVKNKPEMLEGKGLTPFVLAMPEQYKCENAVQAYRNYYIGEKKHLFRWTKRDRPYWIGE